MKLILETTGPFQLVGEGHRVPFNRPAVLPTSHFVQQYTATAALRVLAQVNDDATDQEFVTYLESSEGDQELAVSSFAAAFPVEGAEDPPAPKKPRGAKAP